MRMQMRMRMTALRALRRARAGLACRLWGCRCLMTWQPLPLLTWPWVCRSMLMT
jgi:hypothetical protein